MLSVSILRDDLGKGSEMQYMKYAKHQKKVLEIKRNPLHYKQHRLSLGTWRGWSQDRCRAVQSLQLPDEGSVTWFP